VVGANPHETVPLDFVAGVGDDDVVLYEADDCGVEYEGVGVGLGAGLGDETEEGLGPV